MTQPQLLTGAVQHGLARVATLALGLALRVAVARLGPAVQGAFALFVAIESLLLATCAGLGLVLAREVSRAPGDAAARAGLLRGLLRLASAVAAVAALGLGAWAASAALRADGPAAPYDQLWLLALAAPLLLWVLTAGGLWLGQGRMLALNAPLLAAPALVLALLLLAALVGGPALPLWAVLAAWTLGKLGVAAGAGWTAWRAAPVAPDAAPAPSMGALLRRHGRFIALVAVANLVSVLNLRATLFLVERVGGLAAAGVYSVAVQVAELLWVLSSAVAVAAYHRIGGADPAGAARLTLTVVRAGVGMALVAAPVLGALAWWLLPRVLGEACAAARLPLVVLLPGVALYAAASGLSAFHTNQLGRPQWAARVAGSSLALTLLVASVTVPAWGAPGAALATSLAYVLTIGVALRGFLRAQGWGWAALWGRGVDAAPTAAGPQSRPA